MESRTLFLLFGAFLALNMAGFVGAVVLKQLDPESDEELYDGLSQEAFAQRLVETGIARVDGLEDVDAVAIDATLEAGGERLGGMRIALDEAVPAVEMSWLLDWEAMQRLAPGSLESQGSGDVEGFEGMEELAAALSEFSMVQVGDHLVLTLAGETYEMRGAPPPAVGSVRGFLGNPLGQVPGAEEQDPDATPASLFDALFHATGYSGMQKVAKGTFEGEPAWRVEFEWADEEAAGTGVFIVHRATNLPLVMQLTVTEPGEEDVPPIDFEFRFAYNSDVHIGEPEVPPGAKRLPADFGYERTADTPDRIEGTLGEGASRVPLEELELRVVEVGPGEDMFAPAFGRVRATLPLDEGEVSENGFRLRFIDNGDGVLSAGDRFVADATGAAKFGPLTNSTLEVDVRFYDEWARAYEGTPGFGAAWLLAGLGALFLARGRRRT